MAKASWAPPEPISVTDSEAMGRYVREALRCQAKLGAAAYLVPGLLPDHKQDDLRPAYDALASILGTLATVLNVSRPTVVKLIDDGALPSRKVGSHRRINLADLLAYRDDMVARRRAVLNQMSRDAEDLGLYD